MAEATSISPTTTRPTATSSAPLSSITPPNTAGIDALANATQLVRPSSPRKRDRTPEAAAIVSAAADAVLHYPLSSKSILPGTAPPLTAAAEMVEQAKRRKLGNAKDVSVSTSENPAAKAAAALSGEHPFSRLSDAPHPSKAGAEPMAGVEPSRNTTLPKNQDHVPIDPAVTGESAPAGHRPSLAENRAEVASPGPIEDDEGSNHAERDEDRSNHLQVDGARAGKALTLPPKQSAAHAELDRRNMSVDSGMPREEAKTTGSISSSGKKHKCPYCATEFTRHHNLKSHLLTHSHEKPYLCQDCDSRFRRLHDLKRHMKLHTGERPHVCPICQRSFARGDALARHNKGQGGCALRRYSQGSFGDGDESMEGMIYTTGDASQEPESMDRDGDGGPSPRTSNVPSIRHHEAPEPARGESQYQRTPSTYPPVANRAPNAPMGSSLYPPGASHGGANGPQSPNGQSASHGTSYPPPGYTGGSGYPPMTESPKPLSPSQHPSDTRNRSPSISQLNANQFARQPTSRELPPPPTHSSAPTLPPPHGMQIGPPDSRYGPSAPGSASYPPPQSGMFPGPGVPGGGPSSASNSLSSHGTGPAAGSGERGALPYSNDDRLWAIIRSLEMKVERLEGEVSGLRQQLQHQPSYPPPTR